MREKKEAMAKQGCPNYRTPRAQSRDKKFFYKQAIFLKFKSYQSLAHAGWGFFSFCPSEVPRANPYSVIKVDEKFPPKMQKEFRRKDF
tara:strand:- start:372 stop:635 length:264 start_codon:yes stop_codon:yes gene_type:complete